MHADNRAVTSQISPQQNLLRFEQGTQYRLRGPSESVREFIATYYDMTPLESDLNLGHCQTQNWFGANCIFSQAEIDMVTVRRTKGQAENGGHLVYIHRYLSGSVRGQFGDVSIDRDPGSVYVFDMERRVECVQFPITVRGLYVPKWLVGYESALHPALIEFPSHEPVGSILQSLMDSMFEDLHQIDAVDHDDLDQFLGSLKVALGADPDDDDVRRLARRALNRSMRAFIETNLSEPDLGAHLLLKTFGVSRASLYRMFEPYGGVRQYISDRRLYRAVLELSEKPLRRGDIVDIAERWNFSSHANFSRSVKRQFGTAPGGLVHLTQQQRNGLKTNATVYAFSKRTQTADRVSA